MIVLNVSFGIYAFLTQGWILMIAIILIECLGLSYFLTKKIKNKKIYNTVIISNIISGIVGIIGSMILNGSWWLVVWLPWVSSNEVSSKNGFKTFVIFYLIAFLLTIIIEGIVNYLMLKKEYPSFQILKMTLLVNSISYLLGSLAMYTYSF
jgi:sterol desaturase/sphingolipid hydroxylase (fatty acid hydroxylase superfamily)